jgi:asparagine synthase (glutamine-hydrolysing)
MQTTRELYQRFNPHLPSFDVIDHKWFTKRGATSTYQYFNTDEKLKENLAQSISEYSLPHLLRYEDRNSMTYSIESRVPFLTTEFVDFILSLQEEYLIDNKGVTKNVFRLAMKGIVPGQILERKDKIGFWTPEKDWLFGEKTWVESVLKDGRYIPFMNVDKMLENWHRILAAKAPFGLHIWRWVNLIKWSEIFEIEYD